MPRYTFSNSCAYENPRMYAHDKGMRQALERNKAGWSNLLTT